MLLVGYCNVISNALTVAKLSGGFGVAKRQDISPWLLLPYRGLLRNPFLQILNLLLRLFYRRLPLLDFLLFGRNLSGQLFLHSLVQFPCLLQLQ